MDRTQEERPEPRSPFWRWTLLFGLVLATLVFAALGTWQVHRLQWKLDLIQRVEARLALEPVPMPAPTGWASINSADDEYKRVAVSGHFLNDKEAHVVASTERGPGFWVMTPFVLGDGTVVIVNRGFVPGDRRDASARSDGQIAGETFVTGLLRLSEASSWILRRNDPEKNRWYRRDPREIGEARGLSNVAPFFIDADATPNPGGWPLGGMTRVQFSNSHLVYAITWFALAVMAAFAITYVVRDTP
jgi:surfeit locus 1 family protein